jgi:hypothetical protein
VRKSIVVAGVAAAFPLVVAAPAAAQSTTAAVADGQTMLRLYASTAKALSNAGVRVSLVRPATVGRSGLTFPVTGGSADPATLAGSVRHSGGIRFRAGGRSVVLRSFIYRVGSRSSYLTARVGNTRVRILNLDLDRARVSRDGLGTAVRGIRATLTRTAAAALNDAFDVHLFRGGLRIGTVRSEVSYGEVVFAGGETSLALDAGAGAALQSLGITASPLAPSTGLAFAITGGKVNAETLAGTIQHSGGIALTRGATSVELRDFEIAIDETPSLSAAVGSGRVEILSLDVANITRSVEDRTVTVGNVGLKLTAAAAGALNSAFATTAFTEGLVLGTATVRGEAR